MEELTRDVRTVFVGQLQVRATEKDIKRFFKKAAKVKVNDVQVRSRLSFFFSFSLVLTMKTKKYEHLCSLFQHEV